MRKRRFIFRRASGLWEIALGVMVTALVLSCIQQVSAGMMSQARLKRTYQEMSAILSAGRQYEAWHGAWPATRTQLLEVMPQAPSGNPWGRAYMMEVGGGRLWVVTSLPRGIGPSQQLRMSTAREFGSSWRLMYEKRNIYAP